MHLVNGRWLVSSNLRAQWDAVDTLLCVNCVWLVSSSLRAQWDAVDTFLCVDCVCGWGLTLWCPKGPKVSPSRTLFLRETALVPPCGATGASLETSLGTLWCPRGGKVPALGPLGAKKAL